MKDLSGQHEDKRSDGELVKGYLAGDASSFDVLYARYDRRLYGYLNRLLAGRPDSVDDLFQQCWLKALDKFGNYKENGNFNAWLLRIAHNLAIDLFRARKGDEDDLNAEELADELPSDVLEPWRALDRDELGKALDSALTELSAELREVFLLRLEDVPFKEIAEIQGTSINTALSRMQYAMRNLRKALESWSLKSERDSK